MAFDRWRSHDRMMRTCGMRTGGIQWLLAVDMDMAVMIEGGIGATELLRLSQVELKS